MITSIDDIFEKLDQGILQEYRTGNLELKKGWSQAVGKKISAFANSILQGPIWLCVGIDDNGFLCHCDERWAKSTEESISQHLNQYLDPQLTCNSVTCYPNKNGWFVAIRYENPGAVVYWDKKAYKGLGTTIQEMSPADVMKLTVSLPGLTDYSAQPWLEPVDSNAVLRFSRAVSSIERDVPIVHVKSLCPEEILNRLGIENTRTCQILFGPCRYRVVFYDKRGNPVRNENRSTLFHLLDKPFHEEIQNWSREQLRIVSTPYPERALAEALANAVAHAAYVESFGDIIIELFADRICICNLCTKESTFFANKWFSRAHNTINRTLMETLRIAGFVDELGRGKNLIFAESLRHGKRAPEVSIERGGRYDRWRLLLHGGVQDRRQIKLLNRLKEIYQDEQKALIANALVLWRGRSVSDIRQYIDGESSAMFADVLTDLTGPIFYYEEKDQIVHRRWVRVLLGEGKDSKQFSPAEETDLQNFARKLQTEYQQGYITPKRLRELAGMGATSAEKVLTSNLLKKWCQSGIIRKVRQGLYQFTERPKENRAASVNRLLEQMLSQSL